MFNEIVAIIECILVCIALYCAYQGCKEDMREMGVPS